MTPAKNKVDSFVVIIFVNFCRLFLRLGWTDLYQICRLQSTTDAPKLEKKISDTLLSFDVTALQGPNFALFDTNCKN